MINVLIVDDDPEFCILLKQQLLDYDISAITADNTTYALELLKEHEDLSVVISDIHMRTPVEGITFLEQVANIAPNVARLVLTGFDNDIEWARQTPGIWRIAKPHQIEDVAFAVYRLSEPSMIVPTDKILDDIIQKIHDTSINTAGIEKKLNGLITDGLMAKIEQQLRFVEKHLVSHESLRNAMEEKFVVKVDDVCSFYHKFILAIISGVGGIAVAILGIVLKHYFFK
jgi:response regulator RpfG family c-di-GMP phosphodiesterase